MASHPSARPVRRNRPRKIVLWGLAGVLVLGVASAAWVGVRGVMAKGELESAIPLASTIQSQVLAGDSTAAASSVEKLASHSKRAASLTSDPVWRAFELLPWAGNNLTGVRQIAAVVDDVSQNVVGPLTAIAGVIDPEDFKPVDGAINTQPLVDAQPQIVAANAALLAAEADVAVIDTRDTISVVQDAADRLHETVSTAAASVSSLNRVVHIVPAMLGADGPRNYVLMFQNPAELRSTGGNPGALALLRTENGRLELTQQASSADFPRYESPVIELPNDTRSIYGDITGQFVQDATLTPQFPMTGEIVREMWLRQFGVTVDGVISLDPVTLSYVLNATGPITLETGDVLTAANAVQLLLSEAYARYPRADAQDAFFAAAAGSVFQAVAGGSADPVKLIEQLGRAGAEHRVLVWSAHEDEQAVLLDTTIAGGLPVNDRVEKNFGIYMNDGTGSKMDVYLDVKYAVGQTTCRLDRRPTYGVDVTLTNTAPSDAATSLPGYVTGGFAFGVTPGNIKTMVSAYGAPSMENRGMTRDGAEISYHPATDEGYPVSSIDVELAPGESTVLHFGWLGAEPFDGLLNIQSTPLINLPKTTELTVTC
ncbi:DUF4012 domain-containing protein [Cryobacterium psychrophilum]|uniref:DUF4012 domain-containing protein n=1 Tax=Cryobacterium psychrophilum TaxID=41988 RepID=A0A4Y8KVI1_9MICO|nr:DUF4012 domain-containing protein [Cryobacterium psychrophilum]TFD80210.1 DUF4012 domain-containing protein [Cryobacterium psychrophilum]